jgi:hypothetical protein
MSTADKPGEGRVELPAPRLRWTVRNADGTIAAEGYALPVAAGAKAGRGTEPQGKGEAQDAPESTEA